ncbi:hypothetical protein [Sphingomonas dokdonensis]|uniref:Uncharacterized protein n=1 Tax=Sphingomonas dokdonensis TaxID=344880 RepID=A0A245ZVE2_9SPHN|nr:hypothetical protein [Sphingomonas dokdonensis]OWK33698.1 hypothetical protein SPDO_05820 [Sphingomonas dokdonensis]
MRGVVEQLHETEGVYGWALDPAEPQRVVSVELWAGTLRLAQTHTGLDRPDVCSTIDVACRPGFRFDDDAVSAITDAAARGYTGDLSVRVAGAGRLGLQVPPLTLEMVRKEATFQRNDETRLRATLEQHRDAASPKANNIQAGGPDLRIGYLEGAWTSRTGRTWLVGWMIDDGVADRSVVVVDTARCPAGIAFSVAPRADLAAGAKAFVAVMLSEWQLDPDLPPQIVLADGSGLHLESIRNRPLSDAAAILPVIRDTLGRSTGKHRAAMLALFADNRLSIEAQPVAERVQVDEAAVLPGFGVFVNGWALSPSKQPVSFGLEVGDQVIDADVPSQGRFNRPDLAGIFPNVDQALQTAGYVSLFRYPFDPAGLDRLALTIGWSDGTSSTATIPPFAVRLLGKTAPIESLSRFYRAVEQEDFFPDLAYHAARAVQAHARELVQHHGHPSRAAILLAVPSTAADIFLLFDRVNSHAAALSEGWGIAFIARSDDHRGLVLTLFAQLQRSSTRPCSLFFTLTAAPTSDAIDAVAKTLSAERIGWIASHVSLTKAGWQAFADETESLALFEIEDPAGGPSPVPDLDAFVADLSQWRRISGAAVPQIGGIRLPPQHGSAPVIKGAASLLHPSPVTPFTRKINEAIRRVHG